MQVHLRLIELGAVDRSSGKGGHDVGARAPQRRWRDVRRRLKQSGRLEKTADFIEMTDPLRRDACRCPMPGVVLRDQAHAMHPREKIAGHGPAYAEMSGEPLVVDSHGSKQNFRIKLLLDIAVHALPLPRLGDAHRFQRGQTVRRRCRSASDAVAALAVIEDDLFAMKRLQRAAGGRPADPKGLDDLRFDQPLARLNPPAIDHVLQKNIGLFMKRHGRIYFGSGEIISLDVPHYLLFRAWFG